MQPIVTVALLLTATRKRANKTYIYLCKSTEAKYNVISFSSSRAYGMTNAINYKYGFASDIDPKRDNTIDNISWRIHRK